MRINRFVIKDGVGSIPMLSVMLLLLLFVGCKKEKIPTPVAEQPTQIVAEPPATITISGYVMGNDDTPIKDVLVTATTTDWDHDSDCDLRDWSFSQNQEPQNWRHFLPNMKGPGVLWH